MAIRLRAVPDKSGVSSWFFQPLVELTEKNNRYRKDTPILHKVRSEVNGKGVWWVTVSVSAS